jgi:hypothetical protein
VQSGFCDSDDLPLRCGFLAIASHHDVMFRTDIPFQNLDRRVNPNTPTFAAGAGVGAPSLSRGGIVAFLSY